MKKLSSFFDKYFIVVYIILIIGCSTGETGTNSDITIPVLTTSDVVSITQISAVSGGDISSEGGANVNSRGICWSASPVPTIYDNKTIEGAGPGSFTSSITGLIANTTYYVRAYATNNAGTGYGETKSFSTLEKIPETVTDIDGNVYHTIKIGEQIWMVENLKTTKYRNGDEISHVSGNSQWSQLTKGAYCFYNNNSNTPGEYGKLYNWYAAKDNRNIAPEGWRIPTDADFTQLINFLGGQETAGGNMKEKNSSHWSAPNTGATNESGFTALPGGLRHEDGSFNFLKQHASFWSTTASNTYDAFIRDLYFESAAITRHEFSKKSGFSIRCIKE